jgi:hypothetical protein
LNTTNISGDLTFTNNSDLYLKDNGVINFGDSNDLQIYHNSSVSVISDGGTGGLLIQSDNEIKLAKNGTGNDNLAVFTPDGPVELYYDNSKKFETIGAGVTITGTTFTNQLNVSGVVTALNGPVIIGAATSTGTADQRLQVTGHGYVSGILGIGTTNPTSTLEVSGTIKDSIGNVRSIPQNSQTSAYILAVTDVGKHVAITTGGITVPSSTFSTGDNLTIFNNSDVNQMITPSSGVSLRRAGVGDTGARGLNGYGLATILCIGSNSFVITGAGLT